MKIEGAPIPGAREQPLPIVKSQLAGRGLLWRPGLLANNMAITLQHIRLLDLHSTAEWCGPFPGQRTVSFGTTRFSPNIDDRAEHFWRDEDSLWRSQQVTS